MTLEHPRLYVTAGSYIGLLSLDELRRSVTKGPGHKLWCALQDDVNRRAALPPYDPSTPLPNRSAAEIERRENDYRLSEAALQRVTDAALAYLIGECPKHRDDALRQLECLFDLTAWPEWRHPVNAEKGIVADHRIGSHLRHLSIAYDWLYPALRPDQRDWLLTGIRDRALQPVIDSRTRDSHWSNYNNWTGVIVAGLGIAGMAFDGEIEEASELLDIAIKYQCDYLQKLGPKGEFNESPFYAGSVLTAISFFEALRYYQVRRDETFVALNSKLRDRIGHFGRWYAYHVVFPHGVVPFGDCHSQARPHAGQIGVIAELVNDPVLRWFYRRLQPFNGYPNIALELLCVAGSRSEMQSPSGRWPLAKAYQAYGKSVISRSDWNPSGAACLVAAKAAHGWEQMRAHGDTASYHMDYDAGQVCITASGEDLIVDLGSSGGYAKGERGSYYGKGTAGHNVLMVDNANTRELGNPLPQIAIVECDETRGSWCRFELTGIYKNVLSVSRTIVHLLPGTVVVMDEAVLDDAHDVSLRWHTPNLCYPDADGNFVVAGRNATAICRMQSLAGEAALAAGRHRYHPPYDTDYYGAKLDDGHPYVEAALNTDHVVLLTMFSVVENGCDDTRWAENDGVWSIDSGLQPIKVTVDEEVLSVTLTNGAGWRVPRSLRSPPRE